MVPILKLEIFTDKYFQEMVPIFFMSQPVNPINVFTYNCSDLDVRVIYQFQIANESG